MTVTRSCIYTWSTEATAAKRAERDAQIPAEWLIPADKMPAESVKDVTGSLKTCGVLDHKELQIVYMSPEDLTSSLASGALTAVAVTRAFCKAAAVAQQLTNCLTAMFFSAALERAAELDRRFVKNGRKPVGPLHGIPISLKDQFQLKGTECNMGIVSWLGNISTEDSVLVTMLYKAGAVIHVRTNVPQALMFSESDNYVYGQTVNPYNRTLTAGGSSGGEGALVAMRGSVIGVGTDLGGSVRIPAAFQGLFGLRPSLHRYPYAGALNTLLGLEGIQSALGPLTTSVDGVASFTKGVLAGEPWLADPKTPEIPWRQDMADLKHLTDKDGNIRKPVFGVLSWDKVVLPHPPVRRALQMAVDAVKEAGYEVVEFEPYKVTEGAELCIALYGSDGGEDLKRTFAPAGEPMHPLMVVGHDEKPQLSVYDSWQLNLQKDRYQQGYLAHWNATAKQTSTGQPIDGLLLPSGPTVAHVIRNWRKYLPYTSLFNLLDMPAMTIPVNSSVSPELDPVDADFTPASDIDAVLHGDYSPEALVGAPICAQLACRRLREEELIGLSAIVEKALKSCT